MSQAKPFVVPEGVTFNIEEDGLTIANQGDVVLHTTFGRPIKSVVSHEGSVTIHGDAKGGSIQAGTDVEIHGAASLASVRATGNVNITGNVQAGTIRGENVRIGGTVVAARGIQGERSVTIGDGKVTVDAILAPEVNVSQATVGRVTVIESHNELGPNGLKGCFRLADYAEMFGDPATFLEERGLNAIGGTPPAPSKTASTPAVASAKAPLPVSVIPVERAIERPIRENVEQPIEPAARRRPTLAEAVSIEESRVIIPPDDIEVDEDDEPIVVEEDKPASVAVPAAPAQEAARSTPAIDPFADLAEAAAAAPAPAAAPVPPAGPEHPMHKTLAETVAKIIECYAGGEIPPAVERLHTMVEARQYDQVRADITNIWSELLKFHQKKGLRIQHTVTTTFNSVNSLIKKM